MTEVWKTAEGWAAEGLPDLPATESALIRRAKRECWTSRERNGRGGGREYALAALPKAARVEYGRRQLISASRSGLPAPIAAPAPTHMLKGWQRECMEARAAVLAEVDRLALTVGLVQARLLVEQASADGSLDPALQRLVDRANDRQGSRSGVSAVTLKRWQQMRSRGGVPALAPKPAKTASPATPAWLPHFLDLYQIHGKPSVAACWDRLGRALPEGMPVPPLRTVQRYIERMPALERNRGRMGIRALRALKAYTSRDVSELWPAAVYVPDGHTLKATVAHPIHGRPFRPEITGIIDVYSARIVGWSAALSENTIGTLDACRHAFERSGVCDMWYSDRGRGFNNEAFDDEIAGFIHRWQVTKWQARAYNAQARGVIERSHQSLWVTGARFLPSYDGRDVDREARKRLSTAIERDLQERGASQLLMDWDQFLTWAQQQVDDYNNRPHSDLPVTMDPATGRKRHQSPNEVWEAAVAAGWQPDILSAEEHPDLYRPQTEVTVSRCLVRFRGNEFFAPELDLWHGRKVLLGYDIHDATRVWVRSLDQQLICVALWNAHQTSYVPVSVARDAHEKRVAARLKRGQARIAKIEAELGPSLIDHQPPPVLEPEVVIRAEAAFARLDARAEAPPAAEVTAAPSGRPRFRDQLQFARWITANPHEATESDIALARDLVKRPAARMWLENEGVDIEALRNIARKAA
ncbi:Mu transposase C-terminal domain-containing protein [Inquilinus sp.]|uniref:Mu transposase C-terminal domain-containing protein n=1 Tax=Inquilinus sp. TaxID=1932117 RepID=UPI00378470DB